MMRNIDEMISEKEEQVMDNSYGAVNDERFEITIRNKASNTAETVLVHPDNTLEEILVLAEDAIGVRDEDGKVVFENLKTKKSSSDRYMTLRDFGIAPGDELLINGDSKVAAK